MITGLYERQARLMKEKNNGKDPKIDVWVAVYKEYLISLHEPKLKNDDNDKNKNTEKENDNSKCVLPVSIKDFMKADNMDENVVLFKKENDRVWNKLLKTDDEKMRQLYNEFVTRMSFDVFNVFCFFKFDKKTYHKTTHKTFTEGKRAAIEQLRKKKNDDLKNKAKEILKMGKNKYNSVNSINYPTFDEFLKPNRSEMWQSTQKYHPQLNYYAIRRFKRNNRERFFSFFSKEDIHKHIYSEYMDGISMSKKIVRNPSNYEDFLKPDNNDRKVLGYKIRNLKYFTEIVPSSNTEINLEKILSNDTDEIRTLELCLIGRGWCKIKYPNKLYNNTILPTFNAVNEWLNNNNYGKKVKYSRMIKDDDTNNSMMIPNPQSEYGYHCINKFKEGLRILTGDIFEIHKNNNKYPKELCNILSNFNKIFDQFSIDLIKCVSRGVYGWCFNPDNVSKYSREEFHDISLFNNYYCYKEENIIGSSTGESNDKKTNQDPDANGENENMNWNDKIKLRYSMLDFVNYFNDKDKIMQMRELIKNETNDNGISGGGNDDDDDDEKELILESSKSQVVKLEPRVLGSECNVEGHSDPGLFALSFLSTNDGLQLFDRIENKWIDIDNTQGIWWNGMLAETIGKYKRMKSGIHRILIDDKKFKPRFTGWYEVSCNFQLKESIIQEAYSMAKMGTDQRLKKLVSNQSHDHEVQDTYASMQN